jgi:hypothetical protein
VTANLVAAGWKKFLLHFLGFGVPFGAVAWFGGWGAAVVLFAWRSYEEFLDWHEQRDTLGKALIDLLSQTLLTSVVVVIKAFL